MKYAPLILILLVLFISTLYIKKNLSKFICACEKETFTDTIAKTQPPPHFKTFDDYFKNIKTQILQMRPFLKLGRADLYKKGPIKYANDIKLLDELDVLIGSLTTIDKPALTGCKTRNDGKDGDDKLVTKDGTRRHDNPNANANFANPYLTTMMDQHCSEATREQCGKPPKHHRCAWYGDSPPKSGTIEGFTSVEYFTTTVDNPDYKILIDIVKWVERSEPGVFTQNWKVLMAPAINEEEYCKFWNFFYSIGIEKGTDVDIKKCVKKKGQIEEKSFSKGQTSLFNFTDKYLQTIPVSNLDTPAKIDTTEKIDPTSTVKSCDTDGKSISKEIKYLDMDKYILKTEMIAPPDMSDYVKRDELDKFKIDKSKYILKSRIPSPSRLPDPNKYILKTELKHTETKKPPMYKGYNIAGGPLDMTMDNALYPMKSRFNTCAYAKVNKKDHKQKSTKDDNNNEYNSNRLSQCKVQRNMHTPDIFGR